MIPLLLAIGTVPHRLFRQLIFGLLTAASEAAVLAGTTRPNHRKSAGARSPQELERLIRDEQVPRIRARATPRSGGGDPGGHSCAQGAGISVYDAETETWSQVRDFMPPAS